MVVFSFVVEPVDMSEARKDLGIHIRVLVDFLPDLIEVLDAVMVLTKGQLLVGLRDLKEENGIGAALHSLLARLEELDGVLDGLKLPAAMDRDYDILQVVEPVVKLLDQFLVEGDQLIAITTAVEGAILHVRDDTISHLMPHLGRVISFQLVDLLLQLGELNRMLIKQGVGLCNTQSGHIFFG